MRNKGVNNIFTFTACEFKDHELENEYMNSSSTERNSLLQKNLLIAMAVTLLFLITDYFSFINTPNYLMALVSRIILALICASGLLFIKFFPRPRDLQNALFVITLMYLGVSAILFSYVPYPSYSYIISGILIVLALCIFLPQRFNLVIASTTFTSFSFLIPLIMTDKGSAKLISEGVTYLLAANVFGIVTIRELNFYKRKNFLVLRNELEAKKKLEVELAAKKNLEKKLKQQVSRDYLTGLYNRRFFYGALKTELSRARRHKKAVSLILFDMDHFKEINDTYGHLSGDEALKSVAKVIAHTLRQEDVFARIGGEEFIVLSPDLDLKKAGVLAERLRLIISEIKFSFNASVSASFGIVEVNPEDDVDMVMHLVDQAMYHAKKSGRNRIHKITMDGTVSKSKMQH